MAVEVVPYSPAWPLLFEQVAQQLRAAVGAVAWARIEHVGSTSVPGLAAKPVLDIDVIVSADDFVGAIDALVSAGYEHLGDLGVSGREAFQAPDDHPRRHVYVCLEGTLHVRNHLAVRDVLRTNDQLRAEYAAVKLSLAADPSMDMGTYVARKSAVLQRVLAASDLTEAERFLILQLNDPSV